MQTVDIYRQMSLDNGLEIIIRDLTRVYFGDYHLVRLEIICRSSSGGVETITSSAAAPVEFRRIVERMGVPSAEIETVRDVLIQDFLNNSLAYLNAADFPAKLAQSVLRQPKKIIRSFAEKKQ